MKKKLFIIISIFIIILSALTYFKNKQSNNQEASFNSYEYNYFNPINSSFYYGDDMELCNSIYYKIIENFNEYIKFKEYYNDIIDMNENDFKDNLLILTISENESTKNLAFHQIYSDNNKTYIELIKKQDIENTPIYRGISIKIDKKLYKNNIDIFQSIENTNFMTEYTDIKKLPINYNSENAINENCFVITSKSSSNIDLFNIFINESQNNQNSEIRIFYNNNLDNSITIYDIKYSSTTKKYYVCIDSTRNQKNNYGLQTYNYYIYDSLKEIPKINSEFVVNNNHHNYLFENLDFPETNLSLSFLIN